MPSTTQTTERWRDVGVTHWHLIEPREWSVHDTTRFDTERMRAERVRSSAGVARTPAEVVQWLGETLDKLVAEFGLDEAMLRQSGLDTPEKRALVDEVRRDMADNGRDVCSMLAIRGGRICHYSAYAMTERDCSAPHPS